MKGGIYTSERCQVCGARMVDNRRAVACPEHPEQKAGRIYVRFGTIFKRFKSYQAAERFWTGVRFKTDEGSFDARDYRRDNPLSFDTLISAWLEKKKEKVKPGSYRNLRNYAERAGTIMGGRNVKDITFAHLEDFFDSQTDIGDKTKANMRSALHDFWQWIVRRQVITRDQVPEFPEIDFVLGYRATIDKDTQGAILEKIRELSHAVNPRIWVGVKFLCTYISVRPAELSGMLEGHIDLGNGYLLFPNPKEKTLKRVPLIDEDVELLRQFPAALPHVPFFRHPKGIKGARDGAPFGEKYFWKWWTKACTALGITGVDLYGGTRHSSALALRGEGCSPEAIRRATMHATNKAFERYYRIESDEIRAVYQKAASIINCGKKDSAKILSMKKR
jgi:integrase